MQCQTFSLKYFSSPLGKRIIGLRLKIIIFYTIFPKPVRKINNLTRFEIFIFRYIFLKQVREIVDTTHSNNRNKNIENTCKVFIKMLIEQRKKRRS